jgi:serine/threonine protein kinase
LTRWILQIFPYHQLLLTSISSSSHLGDTNIIYYRKYYSNTVGKTVFTVDVRYRNLKPIGSGSYGVVCSAEDVTTKRKVAIKKVGKVFEDLVDAKRILRELKLLGHLGSHENIIGAVDIITQPTVSNHQLE